MRSMILSKCCRLTDIEREVTMHELDDIEATEARENPRGKAHRGKDDIPNYMEPEQVYDKYIVGMRVYPYEKQTSQKKLRDQALIAALYTTGLRVQELLSVRLDQVEDTPDFLVFSQVPIGKRRDKYTLDKALPKKGRLAPFTTIVQAYWYSKRKAKKDKRLFPMGTCNAYLIVSYSTGEWCHFFRHQHISYLINELGLSTANVARLTGHKSLQTLEGYSHATYKDFQEQLLK